MAMLLRISFLFIAIITFRQADGRYVGGNQRVNTASHKKGTTSRVANSEFQIFCYWVMGPYEETPMTPKILVPAALGGPNGPFLVPK